MLQHLEQSERGNVDLLGSVHNGGIRRRHALAHTPLHLAKHLLQILHVLSIQLVLSWRMMVCVCFSSWSVDEANPQQSVCWRQQKCRQKKTSWK